MYNEGYDVGPPPIFSEKTARERDSPATLEMCLEAEWSPETTAIVPAAIFTLVKAGKQNFAVSLDMTPFLLLPSC